MNPYPYQLIFHFPPDHSLFGIIVFGFIVFLFLLLGKRFLHKDGVTLSFIYAGDGLVFMRSGRWDKTDFQRKNRSTPLFIYIPPQKARYYAWFSFFAAIFTFLLLFVELRA